MIRRAASVHHWASRWGFSVFTCACVNTVEVFRRRPQMLDAMTELSRMQTWPQCDYLLHHETSSPLVHRPSSSDGLCPVSTSAHIGSFTNQGNSRPRTPFPQASVLSSDEYVTSAGVHLQDEPILAPYRTHAFDRKGLTVPYQQYPVALAPHVDELTEQQQRLQNSPDVNDELQLFTSIFSHSGQNGPEEHTSLEVSSETQRAMESSDSTPPSVERTTKHQLVMGTDSSMSTADNSTFLTDSSAIAGKNNWQNSLFIKRFQAADISSIKQETGDGETERFSIVNTPGSHKSSNPPSPVTYTDCDQAMRNQTIHQSSYSEAHSSGDDESDEGMSMARFEQMSNAIQPDQAGLYFCHLCEFTGGSRQEFQDHLHSHYDYKCYKCDYTSRTEGRLRRHMKDFHSDVPPDNFSGKTVKTIRPKLQRCKQCNFMTETKDEFWRHLRVHIKEDKRLECHLCCFVTEYKHHLEYHMRNHMGSKPYKCPKCNYECVNKSMLNSHMKSHSNVYPYRCANCHYATKYCHSLKMHLAKHDHKPAVVLNADGSLPAYDNTVELMNLRRGACVRYSSGRGRTMMESPGTTADQASVKSRGSPLNHPGSPIIPFSHNFPANHFMNSNIGTGSSILKNTPNLPDALTIGPYANFPFNYPTQLPPFAAVMFPGPILGPAHLFPNSNALTKSTESILTQPTTTVNPLHFMNNSFAALMPQSESIRKNPYSWPVSDYSLPNASLMAALLAAVQQNTSVYAASNVSTTMSCTEETSHSGTPIARLACNHPGKTVSTMSSGSVLPVFCDSFEFRSRYGESRGSSLTPVECHVAELGDKAVRKLPCQGEINGPNGNSDTSLKPSQIECALDLSAKPTVEERLHTDSGTVAVNGFCVPETSACWSKGGLIENVDAATANAALNSEFTEEPLPFQYECRFCEIRFRQRTLYDIHMGFHSHKDPYLCNRCGHQSRDPVEFFIHLGQMAHHS